MSSAKGTVNKVILIGRLGQDPETSNTTSGITCAKFSLATNRAWKDDGGNLIEKTDWHRVVAWRALADIVSKYLQKGSQVYVEGRLETRSWDDKDGTKKYMTEVVAENIAMLGSRPDGNQEEKPKSAPKSSPKPATQSVPEMPLGPDDELPF